MNRQQLRGTLIVLSFILMSVTFVYISPYVMMTGLTNGVIAAALIFWIAGMKYTLASLAAILTQTTTVFILLLAILFLHERLTARKLAAAALAVAGVLLIVLT